MGARYTKLQDQPAKCAPAVFAKLGKAIQIRTLAWDGYNENFLNMARELCESTKARQAHKRTSLVDTRTGKGFTCEEDILFLKINEEKKKAETEVRGLMCACVFAYMCVYL